MDQKRTCRSAIRAGGQSRSGRFHRLSTHWLALALAALSTTAGVLSPAPSSAAASPRGTAPAALLARVALADEPVQLSIRWDDNGQIESRTVGAGATARTTTYAFDARHELIGATLPGGTVIAYSYQPDGNLQSRTKTLPDGTRSSVHFFVDTNRPIPQVVAEYDDDGHATAAYTYGLRDELLMRRRGSEYTYYQHDALGSVTSLSDDNGRVIATYQYDAWGNTIASTGSDDNPYRFAGERFDPDLGFIYLRARWYDPQIGRFVSADPHQGEREFPLSNNRYVYADGDPANLVDPSGRDVSLGGLGAALGVGALLGAITTPIYNYALGRATTLGDVLQGAIVGAGFAGTAYIGGTIVTAIIAGVSIGSSGALAYEVFDDPGSTWGQRVAASALLLSAVAGPAYAIRFSGEVWNRPTINEYRVLHDMSVAEIKAFFEANGFKVATEVYVRNPYYKIGRRYDLVVRDTDGRYIAFEFKSTEAAASSPPSRQVRADGWVEREGGEMFGSSATKAGFDGGKVAKVILLGPSTAARK